MSSASLIQLPIDMPGSDPSGFGLQRAGAEPFKQMWATATALVMLCIGVAFSLPV